MFIPGGMVTVTGFCSCAVPFPGSKNRKRVSAMYRAGFMIGSFSEYTFSPAAYQENYQLRKKLLLRSFMA